jgi:steroid delta-isomerase-like uncharacterized protein
MDERLENNKKLICQFIELTWNQAHFNLARSLVAPEFTYHASMINQPMTLEGMSTLVNIIRDAMEDFTISVDEVVAEGNLVVTQSTFAGTLVKPLMGFEPTDRMVALSAATFWKFRQGVVQSGNSILDTADLVHQTLNILGKRQDFGID